MAGRFAPIHFLLYSLWQTSLPRSSNALGLCVRAGFEAENSKPALNINGSTKFQACTSARLTENLCYKLAF
jgi:hypothetical protein